MIAEAERIWQREQIDLIVIAPSNPLVSIVIGTLLFVDSIGIFAPAIGGVGAHGVDLRVNMIAETAAGATA